MNENKRAAVYARVSTAAQGEEDKASIPEQVSTIEHYCQKKGYEIADRYVDIGYSGTTKNRPEFQRMLKSAKESRFDVIVSWKIDRISRGMYPAAALLEVVESLGITIEAATEVADMRMFGLLAAIGEIELKNIVERTRFGREQRARVKGLVPGGNNISYGYKLVDGKIEIENKEAKYIRHLFQWILEGKSARSWTIYANTNGYVSRHLGQGVTPQQISQWLRNPIYKGEYHWNKRTRKLGRIRKTGNDIVISCPAIISSEVWQRVQDRLAKNKRWSSGNTKEFYLLQKLAWCKECGKMFICGNNNGGRYYVCYGTRFYPHRYECRKPHTIKADLLEKQVWDEIMCRVNLLVSEDDVLFRLIDDCDEQQARLDQDLAREKESVNDCKWQRQLIATRERQHYLTSQDAKLQYSAIKADEERHLEEISKLTKMKEQNNSEIINEYVERLTWVKEQFEARNLNFDDIPNEKKREFIRQIVDRVIIDGKNNVEVRLKLEPQLVGSIVNLSMHHTT